MPKLPTRIAMTALIALSTSLALGSCVPDTELSTNTRLPTRTDDSPSPAPDNTPDDEQQPGDTPGMAPEARLVFFVPGLKAGPRQEVLDAINRSGLMDRGSIGIQVASGLQGRGNFPDRVDASKYLRGLPKVVDTVLARWPLAKPTHLFWDYEPREGGESWIRSERFTPNDAAFVQRVRATIQGHLRARGLDIPVSIYGPRIPRGAFGPTAKDRDGAASVGRMLAGWDWQMAVLYAQQPIDPDATKGITSPVGQRVRVLKWVEYFRELNPNAEVMPFLKLIARGQVLDEATISLQVRASREAGCEVIGIWLDASSEQAAIVAARAVQRLAPAILAELDRDTPLAE